MMGESEDETSALWLANVERVVMEGYEADAIEQTIPSNLLGQLQQALYRSMKARQNLIGLVQWELFSKDKYLVKRALVSLLLRAARNEDHRRFQRRRRHAAGSRRKNGASVCEQAGLLQHPCPRRRGRQAVELPALRRQPSAHDRAAVPRARYE